MKIYPSNHKIKVSTESHIDTDLNIPLAYINVDYTKYDISNEIHSNFAQYTKRIIAPGETFDRPDVKLFNEFEEEVNTDTLFSRLGDKYMYNPKSSIMFEPQTFLYKATIKKNVRYKISSSYNLTIGCVDDPDSLDLSQRLSEVFTNPAQRNLLPSNISINNNKMSQYNFTNMSMKDADFVFIESPDGQHYSEEGEVIDFNSFLDNNANIWLGCDDHPIYKYENIGQKVEFKLQSPLVLSNTKMLSDIYFDTTTITEIPGTIIHNPFVGNLAPVLIIEHIGKAFTIISHTEVLQNMADNASLMYEILMYVYLNCYDSTPNVKEWIANEVPDYEIQNNSVVKKNNFVSTFDLSKYFGLKTSEMQLFNVDIFDNIEQRKPEVNTDLINTTDGITYIGMTNNRLMFEKNKTFTKYSTEPEKPFGWKSIYDGDKIIYVDTLHYIIESSLNNKIFSVESDTDLQIKILPFKSSLNAINMQYPTDITIPFIITKNEMIQRVREGTFVVYIKNNIIDFCYKEDFENNGLEMFTVIVKQTPEAVKVHDMRQLGGGLPEDMEDNFNLLDIGHMNGRPYRAGGTLVFKMPKKYEKYKDMIIKAIDNYRGADDYPVIFFEDKED